MLGKRWCRFCDQSLALVLQDYPKKKKGGGGVEHTHQWTTHYIVILKLMMTSNDGGKTHEDFRWPNKKEKNVLNV